MKLFETIILTLTATALLTAATSAEAVQEHSYSEADILTGRGLFQGNCSGCHGENGDAVAGADLSTGQFRQGTTDEDLIDVILNGVRGTSMPPHGFLSEAAAGTIVAFMRSLPTMDSDPRAPTDVRLGDATQGRSIFRGKGECLGCHSVGGEGSVLGPELSGIGSQRTPAELELAVLDPNSEVRAGSRFFVAQTRAGETIRGRLLNQDTHTVQMLGAEQNLVSLEKSELADFGFADSPMPPYGEELTVQELADLVSYLVSLNGEVSR